MGIIDEKRRDMVLSIRNRILTVLFEIQGEDTEDMTLIFDEDIRFAVRQLLFEEAALTHLPTDDEVDILCLELIHYAVGGLNDTLRNTRELLRNRQSA